MNYSEKWMTRAMEVAQKGWGDSKPNPSVGAVVVFDGKEVASAHSASGGGPHAEAQAISLAKKVLGESLKGCQLFVTLEPCSHYGKNPPCSLAIFESEISEVYFGVQDRNPQVSGARWLTERGVHCELVDLKGKLSELYRGFFFYINHQRPYVVVKLASDAKGMMAKSSPGKGRSPQKITGAQAKVYTHNLRSWAHGVGVSTQTLKADNPNLTNRINPQEWGGQPAALVWGRSIEGVPKNFELLNRSDLELFICKNQSFGEFFENSLIELGQKGFHQIFIEAGPALAKLLLEWGKVNEWVHIESSKDLSLELAPQEMPVCLFDGFKSQLFEQYTERKALVLGDDTATHYFRPF